MPVTPMIALGSDTSPRPFTSGALAPTVSTSASSGANSSNTPTGREASLGSAVIFDPATAPTPSSHTTIPPVPSEFPALATLTLDELTLLLDHAEYRSAFLAATEEVKLYEAMAASQREDTQKIASSNVKLAEEVKALGAEWKRLQEVCKAKQEEFAGLQAKLASGLERFTSPKLSRELDIAARELQQMSDTVADAFTSEDSTSTATPAAIREFKDEFISLRKRYHAGRAKAQILQETGLVPAV